MENQNLGGVKLCRYDYLARRGITAHRSTLWRWEQLGRFPRRVRLGSNIVAWIQSEIDDYLARLAVERGAGR